MSGEYTMGYLFHRVPLRPLREVSSAFRRALGVRSVAFAASARSKGSDDVAQEPRAAIDQTCVKLNQLSSRIESGFRIIRTHDSSY